MMMKRPLIRYIIALLLCLQSVNAQLVHPGISHKQSDLDRMKYMVDAGINPWAETFEALKNVKTAKYDYKVSGKPSNTTMDAGLMNKIRADGVAAYYNALMWYITGDERHAEKAIEVFNAWSYITRNEESVPLSNGLALWRMLEGAEIIQHTYDGWAQEDIDRFKAMLVYPGYSNTQVPERAISSKDVTFYWYIYNGDPKRHGNQGLHCMRTMMAMGIFLDNEMMYGRALRYLKGMPHREDDLPYPSGPPVVSDRLDSSNEYYDEFKQLSRSDRIEDYGYNSVMSHYIWENGQCQESARDQVHTIGGVNLISLMGEMAWSQGDDLYGHLDNRQLLGLEYSLRYNLSDSHSFPDQPTPWEPTVESGEFIQRSDRSGRWKSLKINPYNGNNTSEEALTRGKKNTAPIYEMNLAHYRDRMNLPPENYKWLERGLKLLIDELGFERELSTTAHSNWGGLIFRRISPGDPVTGFVEGVPEFAMHVVPGIVEAEHYDHFAISGQDRTYHDNSEGNDGKVYREDDVDLWAMPAGGHAIFQLDAGEWLTYTLYVPKAGDYDVKVRYIARNQGAIRVEIQNESITDDVTLPATAENSWATYTVGKDVPLKQGVQSMKLVVAGASGAYVLDQIIIEEAKVDTAPAIKETPPEVQPKVVEAPEPAPQLQPEVAKELSTTTTTNQSTEHSEQRWLLMIGLIFASILALGILKRLFGGKK